MSAVLPSERMTLERFLEWSGEQPEKFELIDGIVVAVGRDRVSHNRAKRRSADALDRAIAVAGLDCEAFVDGVGIGMPEGTFRLPDAAVQCGGLDEDALLLSNPVVAVEIVSPTSEERDVHAKLADYFAAPSIAHYLIVYDDRRHVVLHLREDDGVHTAFVKSGRLTLDPPGLSVDVHDFFAGEPN